MYDTRILWGTHKMIKRNLGAGVLTAMILFTPITIGTVETSAQTTQQATQKIMWGKSEVTATQIGKITFNTDVKLYKVANGVEKFHLVAKKGSGWRVHGLIKDGKKTYYNLGGGVRVLQSNLSKYEEVPKDLAKKLVEKYGAVISWYEQYNSYPQVDRLSSKTAEDKINRDILNYFKEISYYPDMVNQKYRVVQNTNNRLKISNTFTVTESMFGYYSTTEETRTYNLTTGELIETTSKLVEKNY